MHNRNRWLVVFVLYFSSVVTIINMYKVPPLMMALMKDLQTGMVVGGWFMSVFSLAMIILAFPVVFMLRRLGPLTCGLIAIGSTIIGSTIGALAPTAAVLLTGRIIEGISFGMIGVIAPAVIARSFSPKEVGLPMGIWATWYPVGSAVAYNIAHPIAAATGGWRGFWWVGVVLSLISFIIYALVIRTPKQNETASDCGHQSTHLPLGETFRNARLWALGLTYGFAIIASGGFLVWAPTYFIKQFHWNPMVAGITTSIGFIASIPGNLFGGWLLTKLKNGNAYLITVSILLLATYTWGFMVPESIMKPYLVVIGILMGLVCAGVYTMVPATMGKPQLIGVAMGFMSLMTGLDNLLGAPAMGFFVSDGNWTNGVLPMGIELAIGLLCAIIYAALKPVSVCKAEDTGLKMVLNPSES